MFSLCADAPGGGETALNHLGLFLLYQTTAHPLSVSLPQQRREEISAVDVALYVQFLSALVIKDESRSDPPGPSCSC